MSHPTHSPALASDELLSYLASCDAEILGEGRYSVTRPGDMTVRVLRDDTDWVLRVSERRGPELWSARFTHAPAPVVIAAIESVR